MLQSHTTPAMSGTISLYRFFVILTVAAHSICCGATDNEKDVYIQGRSQEYRLGGAGL